MMGFVRVLANSLLLLGLAGLALGLALLHQGIQPGRFHPTKTTPTDAEVSNGAMLPPGLAAGAGLHASQLRLTPDYPISMGSDYVLAYPASSAGTACGLLHTDLFLRRGAASPIDGCTSLHPLMWDLGRRTFITFERDVGTVVVAELVNGALEALTEASRPLRDGTYLARSSVQATDSGLEIWYGGNIMRVDIGHGSTIQQRLRSRLGLVALPLAIAILMLVLCMTRALTITIARVRLDRAIATGRTIELDDRGGATVDVRPATQVGQPEGADATAIVEELPPESRGAYRSQRRTRARWLFEGTQDRARTLLLERRMRWFRAAGVLGWISLALIAV